MDTFLECLVKRESTKKTVALKALIILGAIVLSVAIFILGALLGLLFIFICVIIALVFGARYLATSMNLEFEYIVTNGDMDIDEIIAKRKRRRVIAIKFREMEIMAKVNGNHKRDFDNHSIQKFIDVSASPNDDNAYFIIVRTGKTGLTRIIFTPDERILDSAKRFAPLHVFTD